ncbi:MAG TPA: Re/Si-specific NAD(P)(+) transhydrogenase subunit alpha [Thermodesulfobacteriota bacterium]|nr:Re/Si-specific NAD(P)(+) transhydrogenase subunit alpha [Thermodesulfobacteriota bacterium]
MIAGVLKETYPGERRVAIVPAAVNTLQKKGFVVHVEQGAGFEAGFTDAMYEHEGAIISGRSEIISKSDAILQIRVLGTDPTADAEDLKLLKKGAVVIGLMDALTNREAVESLKSAGVTAFALELVPRISRAQAMDVLSSQANIAGYKAALITADSLPKMFPMMMTAAGTITPAHVLVVGAGVAGLQAIATCNRLGAVVSAYDIRPAVKEQVKSLGAKFVELELETGDAETEGGYAKAMDEDFYRKQRALLARVVAENDAVITTAAVPGKKAPVLVTEDMVAGMKPGSVIVDLAAETGGNCELTQAGKTVEHNGVRIYGPVNLASSVPYHASQMYSKNISNLVLLMVKEEEIKINMEDEILKESLVAEDGKIVNDRVRESLGIG